MEQLAPQQFRKHIREKKDLYEAAERNGWYLPAYTSSIITEAYLLHVIEGSTFGMKIEEIKLKACPRPPSKEVLIAKFQESMM